MILFVAAWHLATLLGIFLSGYAALSVLSAQIAGRRWMRERRPLPRAMDLRRSAAARKGWESRRTRAHAERMAADHFFGNVEAMRTAADPAWHSEDA